MRELEKLCRPLVRSLCEYWYYDRCGVTLDKQEVDHTLREHLIRIREKVEDDGHLKREFTRIEQPLVFFIDYTITEGHFPFSTEWQEIARDYNELSGDEKFFEQLSENLDDPDSSERLLMFFLFMGLGFDGCHAGDAEYIQRRMKLCVTRIPPFQLPEPAALSSPDVMQPPAFFRKKRFTFFSVCTLMLAVFCLLLVAWGWNCWVLYQETGNFRSALRDAATAAGKSVFSDSDMKKKPVKRGDSL